MVAHRKLLLLLGRVSDGLGCRRHDGGLLYVYNRLRQAILSDGQHALGSHCWLSWDSCRLAAGERTLRGRPTDTLLPGAVVWMLDLLLLLRWRLH